MNQNYYNHIDNQIKEISDNKLFKHERIITNPQNPLVVLKDGKQLINFCANNYLGLADDADIIATSKAALDKYGYGMASVRFICGTNQIHKDLETAMSKFLGFEDTILFSSCYDANGGLFETMLGAEDAIISDALNHASIIDGVRLCKAKRYRYENNNMQDLEEQLKAADAAGCRFKMIATDGVFSMDGIIANLQAICDLADKYNALVMVDDSHATGFTGKNGRGTPEYCGVEGRIDVITGTLGKALGGASGGYISAKKNVIDLLRNRARTYLFSNSLAPTITAATIKVLEKVTAANDLREQLDRNKKQFREGMAAAGFDLVAGEHAIIPVMLYDEKLAVEFAQRLLDHGIYVIPFSFPVVPKGKARIRTQMSAKHTPAQIEKAIAAFTAVGKELKVI